MSLLYAREERKWGLEVSPEKTEMLSVDRFSSTTLPDISPPPEAIPLPCFLFCILHFDGVVCPVLSQVYTCAKGYMILKTRISRRKLRHGWLRRRFFIAKRRNCRHY